MPNIESSGVEGQLRIRYIRIDDPNFWEDNSHVGNIPAIKQSIRQHGFRDPGEYDPQINDGKGGLVAGEHRNRALREMHEDGEEVPDYILCDPEIDADGMWRMPVIFGADSQSQEAAEAYAIDANNTAVAALPADEMMKLWRQDKHLKTLERLAAKGEMPTSIRKEQLDKWLAKAQPAEAPPAANPSSREPTTNSSEKKSESGDSKSKQPRPTVMLMAIAGPDLAIVEEAFAKTGLNHNRAQALNKLCKFFLDHA